MQFYYRVYYGIVEEPVKLALRYRTGYMSGGEEAGGEDMDGNSTEDRSCLYYEYFFDEQGYPGRSPLETWKTLYGLAGSTNISNLAYMRTLVRLKDHKLSVKRGVVVVEVDFLFHRDRAHNINLDGGEDSGLNLMESLAAHLSKVNF